MFHTQVWNNVGHSTVPVPLEQPSKLGKQDIRPNNEQLLAFSLSNFSFRATYREQRARPLSEATSKGRTLLQYPIGLARLLIVLACYQAGSRKMFSTSRYDGQTRSREWAGRRRFEIQDIVRYTVRTTNIAALSYPTSY
jgi:hypothetical protein